MQVLQMRIHNALNECNILWFELHFQVSQVKTKKNNWLKERCQMNELNDDRKCKICSAPTKSKWIWTCADLICKADYRSIRQINRIDRIGVITSKPRLKRFKKCIYCGAEEGEPCRDDNDQQTEICLGRKRQYWAKGDNRKCVVCRNEFTIKHGRELMCSDTCRRIQKGQENAKV